MERPGAINSKNEIMLIKSLRINKFPSLPKINLSKKEFGTMCNLDRDISNNFEGNKINSSIRLLQGNGIANTDSKDGAMHVGFFVKGSKDFFKDRKLLRYISNLMRNDNVDISMSIGETTVEFKAMYINHIHVSTILELNSHVEDDTNSARKALDVFEIHEYEVISLFYFGNVPLEIEDIIM